MSLNIANLIGAVRANAGVEIVIMIKKQWEALIETEQIRQLISLPMNKE